MRWFARAGGARKSACSWTRSARIFCLQHFWESLRSAGGEVRQFNPVTLKRLIIRNHRKLLVCDGRVAFVGGFNIAPEYEGDGVKSGWCDVGLKIEGALVAQLESSFEEMFSAREIPAQTVHALLRKSTQKKSSRCRRNRFCSAGRAGDEIRSSVRCTGI